MSVIFAALGPPRESQFNIDKFARLSSMKHALPAKATSEDFIAQTITKEDGR